MVKEIRMDIVDSAENAHPEETTPMMKCGHSANATTKDDQGNVIPCCVICVGISPGAKEIDLDPPTLEGRTARCSYKRTREGDLCTSERPSSSDLAFFESHPDRDHDEFYCGCWGWN